MITNIEVPTVQNRLANCTRDRLVYILEEMGGIACDESANKETLAKVLMSNIAAGTIQESVFETEE